jgi:regulator of protease activity HflC (stomatin/prohibitin superfamily)
MSSYARGRERRARNSQMNTVINFVPQQEAWVVERFGKFHDILEPGLRVLYPIVDVIKYVHTLKEIVIEVPSQSGITRDNVTMNLDAVIYIKIDNPYKASYGVEDPEYAVTQLAQTTMRSELGRLTLDEVFKERQVLNQNIVTAINEAAVPWGLICMRAEIKDIALPDTVVEDMQRQVSAERRKRASILESEGKREAAVNVAEGAKASQILASEAERMEQVNQALGEAEAITAKATATAKAIEVVAAAMQVPGGHDAVKMQVAEEYIAAFGHIAKTGNTLLLPANTGDPASMVAQAMSIYESVKTSK